MATQKIETGLIADSAVTTAKLADNSVTAAKIAAGSLDDQVKGISSSADAVAITIDSSENVGIGELDPQEKLQINGNLRMFSAGYPLIDIGITTSNYFRFLHDNPNDIFKIGKNGAATLNIGGSGNVGIGTDNPTGAKLHVAGGVKATDLIAHDSSGINLQTDEGTKRLTINDSGRIHIGTSNTFNAGLTVSNGDIRTSGAAFANDSNSISMSYEGSSTGGGLSVRGPNSTTRGRMFFSVNEGDGGNAKVGISIESDGYVKKPWQPLFLIGTPNPNGAGNVWKSSTIWYNNGGHWNNTTGRFTAPVAGYYKFFHWGMLSSGQGTTTDADVYSRVNGTRDQIGTAYSGRQGDDYMIFNANYIKYLNISDYVDVYISSGTV